MGGISTGTKVDQRKVEISRLLWDGMFTLVRTTNTHERLNVSRFYALGFN